MWRGKVSADAGNEETQTDGEAFEILRRTVSDEAQRLFCPFCAFLGTDVQLLGCCFSTSHQVL